MKLYFLTKQRMARVNDREVPRAITGCIGSATLASTWTAHGAFPPAIAKALKLSSATWNVHPFPSPGSPIAKTAWCTTREPAFTPDWAAITSS